MIKRMLWSSRFIALLLCLALAQFVSAKKAGSAHTAVPATQMTADEIDQRISTDEAEVARISARLDQIRQDSMSAAADLQAKLSTFAGKNSPLESQFAQKNQELASLRSQRDKARQDSLTAATKQSEHVLNAKRESSRLEALVMTASNQLNALTTKRQALPATDVAAGDGKAVLALQKEVARVDSVIKAKQGDMALFSKKREQLRQDSLLQESDALEIRKRGQTEAKRLDSLILVASQSSSEVSGKLGKAHESAATAQAQEQARLNDLSRQKALMDAQIAKTKGELTAMTMERDRLKTASGSSQKRLDAARSPLAAALAGAEDDIQTKSADKEAMKMLMEKVKLDSAISKAKNDLDAAIEQRARGKHGAEKLVDQRENDVTTLMGQLDDVVRKQPKVAQYDLQVSGLTTTELKRKQVEAMIGQANADLAALTLKRDQAKAALDDFDKSHQASAGPSSQRIVQLDSASLAKEKTLTAYSTRRDSLAEQQAASQRTFEGLSASSHTEIARADSDAALSRKQKTDLLVQRAQLRADSMKNESTIMMGIIKVKTEQAKLGAQYSLLDREVATETANKEKLKQAIVDAQSRDKMTKASGLQERRKLDSLIEAKEQEVNSLSVQSEKASQESLGAGKETELAVQKQIAALAVINGQIAAKNQEIAALSQQLDSSRKSKAAAEKAGLDKAHAVEQDKVSTLSALEAKKADIAALKEDKEELERAAVRQREEQEREAKRQHDEQERATKRELARFDSLVGAATQRIVVLEARRDKARQDSVAAETAKIDVITKSGLALHKHDSLTTTRTQQVAEITDQIEKARQDSVVKSSAPASPALLVVKSLDSLIAVKEKELADIRGQREKARLDAVEDMRKQAAVLASAHQAITAHRTQLLQKKAELSLAVSERRRLQQDSALAAARAVSSAQLGATEIAQENALLDKKKTDLATWQTQRDAAAAKLASLTGAASPAPATSAAPLLSAAAAPADAAQKQVEEIYMLIGSNKIEDAVNRFNLQKANLLKYVNAEAFKVLKSTIDQLAETIKKPTQKKR